MAFHRMEPRGRERHGRAARQGERAGANESNALQQLQSPRQLTPEVTCSPNIENDCSQKSSRRKRRRKSRALETARPHSMQLQKIRHDSISRGLTTKQAVQSTPRVAANRPLASTNQFPIVGK